MIKLKSAEDIEVLAKGGAILHEILDELSSKVAVGVTGKELDELAQRLIKESGTLPAFLGYAAGGHIPFPAALCVSINEAVVHGLPDEKPFIEGDVVKLDLGLVYNGLFLDSARTVTVGEVSEEVKRLVDVTKESLELGIAAAVIGNTTGHIGEAVQTYVEAHGLGVVRQLVGHGVGYAVHEDPSVPNFGKAGNGVTLKEGLVIAIEPMVTIGDPAVMTADDGWTVVTSSGKLAAHQEHTIAVTKDGPRILT